MDETIATGRVGRYYKDQLVVDLGDLDLVRAKLDQLGVSTRDVDDQDVDDRLGLARLALPALPQELPRIQRDDEAVWGEIDRRIKEEQRGRDEYHLGPVPELDQLLIILRTSFSMKYDRWEPTLGKNRSIELARGYPHLGGGGFGDPAPVPQPPEFAASGSAPRQQELAGRGVRVAVLDTKVLAHPFLLGKAIEPLTGTLGPDPYVMAAHGTFVSGLILRRAPGARVDVHQVLNERAVGDVWEGARKLAEVAASDVQVINLSWGCYTDDGRAPLVLARAIERLDPAVVVVAASGNHGAIDEIGLVRFPEDEHLTTTTPSWPAAFDRVVAVGATADDGALARFTPRVPWIDLVAPGVEVKSIYLDGDAFSEHLQQGSANRVREPLTGFRGYAKWSGTSFAAATVSGQLAADAAPGDATDAAGAGIRPFTLDDLK